MQAERHINRLAHYDIFIISDAMQAFHDNVSLQPIRAWDKPVLHYEVFFAGGSSYWLERLPPNSLDKFDGYLVVSGIHGVTPVNTDKVFPIGLDLLPRQPFLASKPEFTALLDFPRRGYEAHRAVQESALRQLGIRTINLQGEYTYDEIEKAYQQSAIAFIASPEAFGIPIVQLQHYGSYIASPERSWAMRHALLPAGAAFFDEASPRFTNNFCFYHNKDELIERLERLRVTYDASMVRSCFLEYQLEYVQGNLAKLWEAICHFI